MEHTIVPEDIKLNETEPDGFCSEPRILSHEVARMGKQVTALVTAVSRLVELQSELNNRVTSVLAGKSTIEETVGLR